MMIEEAIETIQYASAFNSDNSPLTRALDMAITALRAQQEVEKNDPLTLDELREMDGEPVWVFLEIEGMNEIHAYAIVDSECECAKGLHCFLLFDDYGAWLAYRRPPKEKENE